ncbi:MAG: Type IV pilus assembly protein PilM [uncultured bacterium]|nr:MAG: Type IV pilus assembly protein PilM [uncultured bacterium]HBY73667.1 hypothetical protein [Candidatus Kerfeldbacteria bacterium]
MRVTGINLSDSSVELVELTTNWFGQGRFTAQQRADLAEGLVENGVIHDLSALAQAIQNVRKVAGDSILSLPESQVYSRWLRFPAETKPADIRHTITTHCSEYIPFEANDVALDFVFGAVSGGQRDVLLLAVPKTIIASYRALAEALHCKLKRLELESLSSARAALAALPSTGAVLLLDVGARTSIASWFTQEGLRFTFNVPLAGQYFTEQVQQALKLTVTEAERLKQRSGFTGKTKATLEQAWQPIIQAINDGMQYLEKESATHTTQVVLIGGSAQLPGATDWLHAQWQLPVSIPTALPWQTKYGMVEELMLNAAGLVLGELKAYRHWPTVNFNNSI